jgi:hypothetical protein
MEQKKIKQKKRTKNKRKPVELRRGGETQKKFVILTKP